MTGRGGGSAVLRMMDCDAGKIAAERGESYEQEETPIPPAIEEVGCRYDKGVLPAEPFAQKPVTCENDRQKDYKF